MSQIQHSLTCSEFVSSRSALISKCKLGECFYWYIYRLDFELFVTLCPHKSNMWCVIRADLSIKPFFLIDLMDLWATKQHVWLFFLVKHFWTGPPVGEPSSFMISHQAHRISLSFDCFWSFPGMISLFGLTWIFGVDELYNACLKIWINSDDKADQLPRS